MLLVGFLFALLIAGVIYYKAVVETDVYRDNSEFTAYADAELDSVHLLDEAKASKREYHYEPSVSYAVEYDAYDGDDIAMFRDKKIEHMKSAFIEAKTAAEEERQEKYGDKLGYKPLAHALLVSSRIYESGNGIISVVIYESCNTEQDKAMQREAAGIHTYQFSANTGENLVPVQIFHENYRQTCAAFFYKYFSKEYGKKELAEDWESHLTAAVTNYNKFVITDRGVTFFFDEGSVLEKSQGPVSVEMPMEEIGDMLRSQVLERYIDPYQPMVAITYDDGPGGEAEARILNCLEKNNAVATFFYQGYRIEGNEEKIQQAHRIGCELGNHTWNHPVLTKLSKKKVRKQLVDTNTAIYNASGAFPTVFRPSYGITDDAINELSNMPVIMWSIDTEDWRSRNAKKVFNHIKNQEDLDGSIILLHSIYDSTARATELLVPWLKKNGYQTVTVSELIKYKQGIDPEPGEVYE